MELIMPGINQARDEGLEGLGTYHPEDQPKIAIEHGHRYNFFCAPDPISNQEEAPGTIMPPGYFFTRLAALSVAEGRIFEPGVDLVLNAPTSGDVSQTRLYYYWMLWEWTVEEFTINQSLNDKIFTTNIDGFIGSYSINDLVPYENNEGLIDVNLYNGIQDNWDERQILNNVQVNIPTEHAIAYANNADETDNLEVTQYFENPESDVQIVVFGHNHRDTLITTFAEDEKYIYANSGTWIDHPSYGDKTANFVVITPQDNSDAESKTVVKVYNYRNETITEEFSDSVRL